MNPIFDAYARYYDLLYHNKDYAAEAEYIASHIRAHVPGAKRILELGCGTGAHAEHLARMGYIVHGVDQSEAMLARFGVRKKSLPPEVATRLSFNHGDIRIVRMGEGYDAVISLFHVMSYQTANSDIAAVFDTASAHLHSGGLFVFDFWYGLAVCAQKPEVRINRLEDGEIKVVRIAEPVSHKSEKVVDVNYTIFIEEKLTGKINLVSETHKMRYFFLPELRQFQAGKFRQSISQGWMLSTPPDENTWAAVQVLVRI